MPLSIIQHTDGHHRCSWCNQGEAFADYIRYHDGEWGQPVADERRLFEKITLEGFQSGLSWITVLRKRDRFREVFAGFDFEKVARFGAPDIERLVLDAGIIRHRGKIASAINNAQRVCDLVDRHGPGALAKLVWSHEPDAKSRPKKITPELAACRTYGVDSENRPQRGQFLPDLQAHSPAMGQKDGEKWTAAVDSQPTFHKPDRLLASTLGQTAESLALSKALKKLGFNFVGPTTMYALMQSMGVVNDHLHGCHAQKQVEAARAAFVRP